ncbi:C15 family peptidase [Psychroflexus aestuariivivens]|uniref:hypothetical protein n=1 Tax=Psychroflexus aestuariivivens TaxID=1795040 RepID=UPI000FD7A4F5|nr:hypothetical protein [Psychroflexus aestuariivivens]
MNYNHNKDSFNKGQAFENYVENVLFPASDYQLIHKTNDYTQNNDRFVLNSKKPDFQFRCLLTGKEFHVEAKYRSRAYKNHYDILSPQQEECFPEIQDHSKPIFIALGYGGYANSPEYVSLIPFSENSVRLITAEKAYQYIVPKQTVSSSLIDGFFAPNDVQDQNIENEEVKEEISNEKKFNNQKGTPTKKKKKKFALFLLSILLIVFVIININSSNVEDNLKNKVETYYQLSDANNIEQLIHHISPNVSYWYGLKNPTIKQIIKSINSYRDNIPFTKSIIQWDSFDVNELSDGTYHVTYSLKYMLRKEKPNSRLITYNLKILTVWNQNMKLISIKEL